jgi:hypothetical protein
LILLQEIHQLNIRASEFFRKEQEYMSAIEELGSRVEDERAHIVQMKRLLEASADGKNDIEAEFAQQLEALKSEKKSMEIQFVCVHTCAHTIFVVQRSGALPD